MDVRTQAKLNQVVCTLEGMATALQRTPGDFAVVIHGDADCANVLTHGMDHRGAERFFCTQLTPDEAAAGRTLPVLEQCLEALCQQPAQGVVFVLGTCLSALVGDDVSRAARAATERHGVPVVALAGAGMRFVPQSTLVDRFARLMARAAPEVTPRARAVNLVGFDPGSEVRDQLARLGVHVNAVLDLGAPVGHWQRLGAAGWNLVLDEPLFAGFCADCAERGIPSVGVTYPVGAAATDRFFAQVQAALALEGDADDVLAGPREAAHAAVADARAHTRGVRLGYNLGSKKNLSPLTLALEGLAEVTLFEELGFELRLLVQGDDHPERRSAVEQTLASLGCVAPVAIFSDTVYYGELCQRSRVALTYASDHLRELVAEAGVGFVAQGGLRPGYGGVADNLRQIRAALGPRGERT